MKVYTPQGKYLEETHGRYSWLLVYLFSFIYFAFKANWRHAVGLFLLLAGTAGLFAFAWIFLVGIIYACRIDEINIKNYIRQGFTLKESATESAGDLERPQDDA